jgi:pantoate--beta-alanine ligase
VIVVHTRAELDAARRELSGRVGLVPTMGALHAGHTSLLDAARASAGTAGSVLLTIFVNPMQFGANEDLSTYPRTLDADLTLGEKHGADIVWVPSVTDVYPGGASQTSVVPGPLGAELEGAVRPTHFAGVLTVVAKFFSLIRPDQAFFGEKDYQQLTLIRRMNVDLELGVDVVGVDTVREPDGLALSSRNVYLDPGNRQRALVLSQALRAGQAAASDGAEAALAAAQVVYAAEPAVTPDYLEVRGVDLGPAPEAGDARLLTAARVGPTRLIDNVAISLGSLPR